MNWRIVGKRLHDDVLRHVRATRLLADRVCDLAVVLPADRRTHGQVGVVSGALTKDGAHTFAFAFAFARPHYSPNVVQLVSFASQARSDVETVLVSGQNPQQAPAFLDQPVEPAVVFHVRSKQMPFLSPRVCDRGAAPAALVTRACPCAGKVQRRGPRCGGQQVQH